MDPATEADLGSKGCDHAVLAAYDGVDRMSCLLHEIRSQIVARLPMRDAARTAVLSSRWRHVWRLFLMSKLSPPSATDGRRPFEPPTQADLRRKSCGSSVLTASDDVLVAKLAPSTNLDPATEARLRRNGSDPPVLPASDDVQVTALSPFTNLDAAMEADLRRKGCDPHKVDQAAEYTLWHIYSNLPKFPVYDDRRFPPVLASSDGIDYMSRLSCQLRCQIVSRLPIKDAARTAVLSTLWRAIWLSSPLVPIDAHLLPKREVFRPTPVDSPAITGILEAHPGPFRCVHLICCSLNTYLPHLARWLQLLAAKGVQELILVNRPWPLDVPLPATVFSITTLTRLYLGQWKLPQIAGLPHLGAFFPVLRELGICCVFLKPGDADYLIARCPSLEILNILGGMEGLRLHLVSPTLRCVQICFSMMEEFAVVKAPRLERLVLHRCKAARGLSTRVRIGEAPMLHSLGYLEPGQLLKIQDAIIVPGIKVSTRNIVSSVKALSLNVCFGVYNNVKMVPTFLKCFPNVERLHIMSENCDKPGRYFSLKLWQKSGPIENIASRIKVMSLREFRGEPSGFAFLEYFFQRARVLEVASIVLANAKLTPFPKDVVGSKLREIFKKRVSKGFSEVDVLESDGPDGGEAWNFQKGSDLSSVDPFSVA